MTKVYNIVKKIHRLLVLILTTFLLIMGLTGLALKYQGVANALAWVADRPTMRSVHNSLSLLFAIALLLMVVTGLLMYILPPLIRRRIARQAPPSTPPQQQ